MSADAGGWRRPRFLRIYTWVFFAWLLFPVAAAIRASLNEGNLVAAPRGLTLEWYRDLLHNQDFRQVVLHGLLLAVATVAVATPLGTALAIGLRRWPSRGTALIEGGSLLAIGIPQVALAAALFMLFAYPMRWIHFGTRAQLAGHITLAIPFVMVIVLVRLRTISPEYELSAMDLGATPLQSVLHVLLPMLTPAVVAGAAVAFVLSWDNLVLSDQLCIPEDCQTVPTTLYGGRNAAPGSGTYAMAVTAFALSLLVVTLAWSSARLIRARRTK